MEAYKWIAHRQKRNDNHKKAKLFAFKSWFMAIRRIKKRELNRRQTV